MQLFTQRQEHWLNYYVGYPCARMPELSRSRWFPIGGFNTVRKITEHVSRDGEVLRREGVITVEVVEALRVGKIAVYNVPRVAVGRNFVQIKVWNFLIWQEAKISYG